MLYVYYRVYMGFKSGRIYHFVVLTETGLFHIPDTSSISLALYLSQSFFISIMIVRLAAIP